MKTFNEKIRRDRRQKVKRLMIYPKMILTELLKTYYIGISLYPIFLGDDFSFENWNTELQAVIFTIVGCAFTIYLCNQPKKVSRIK